MLCGWRSQVRPGCYYERETESEKYVEYFLLMTRPGSNRCSMASCSDATLFELRDIVWATLQSCWDTMETSHQINQGCKFKSRMPQVVIDALVWGWVQINGPQKSLTKDLVYLANQTLVSRSAKNKIMTEPWRKDHVKKPNLDQILERWRRSMLALLPCCSGGY